MGHRSSESRAAQRFACWKWVVFESASHDILRYYRNVPLCGWRNRCAGIDRLLLNEAVGTCTSATAMLVFDANSALHLTTADRSSGHALQKETAVHLTTASKYPTLH